MAARQAGLETVPCRVLELEDQAMCEAALEENLKRKDLNVLEKAQAFQDYLHRFAASDRRRGPAAQHEPLVGLQFSAAARAFRFRQGCPAGRARELRPRAGHPLAVARRSDRPVPADRGRIALGPRRPKPPSASILEAAAGAARRETIPFTAAGAEPSRPPADISNHVRSLEEQSAAALGVPVRSSSRGKEKGKIVIPFSNNDEFERILRQLRRAASSRSGVTVTRLPMGL